MFGWFERRLDAFPDRQLRTPPCGLLSFCLYYTVGVCPWIFVMATFSALIAILEVSLFGFLGTIVDWLSQTSPHDFLKNHEGKLILIAAIILFIFPFLIIIHTLLIHQTLLGNYPMRIRWLFHRYLLEQSLSYFQNEFSGRIATRVMQTALAIRETVLKLFDVLNYVAIYFAGTLIFTAIIDWRFMIPFVVWIFVYIAILCFFIPRLRIASEMQADARSQMTGRVVDTYTNITTVKLFSQNYREENYARKAFKAFQTTVHHQMRLISLFSISVHCANALLLFSVGSIGIFLWLHKLVMVGAIAAGIGLVLRLNGTSQWIMWEMTALFENIGIVKDGKNSLSVPLLVKDKPGAKSLVVNNGKICFDAITFRYNREKDVIKNFNLVIEAGQKVGIVGRSGAGKSTLVNLLLRFHDVKEGRISIDEQDISSVTQESLRAHIGLVTQDTSLLHRSLRENILYGKPNASKEEMLFAVKNARIGDFIETLRDYSGNIGFSARVGERGARLSGGQRQRVALSRVMLKNAPILVLDEATAALDSETEFAIQENLSKVMQGKTVLAIAHRLSTIAAMDRLVVMDQGQLIEDGSHEQLLQSSGLYASLWQKQTGSFLG